MNNETENPSLSEQVASHLENAMQNVVNWTEQVDPAYVPLLEQDEVQREIVQRNYIDGYWRIQQTTPLIIAAMKRFNERTEMTCLRFWNQHLTEELGHDLIMYKDLIEICGSEETAKEKLGNNPITAPSAAIVGFFQWQVEHNNPHLLIILRFFLESYFDNIEETDALDMKNSLGEKAVQTLETHKDADHEHVQACFDYVDQHFSDADLPEIVWCINLIATCLLESQIMIANRTCENLA